MITNFKLFEEKKNDKNIIWGMFNNNVEQIQYGIERGEDVDACNSFGETALMHLLNQRKYNNYDTEFLNKVIDELIKNDADWNIKTLNGKDIFDYADEYISIYLKEQYPEKYQEYLKKKASSDFNL